KLLRKKDFMGMAATADSLPVGYVTGYNLGVWGRIFYVDQLFVAPRYQGKGVGAHLISALHHRLKSRKISMIFLLTKPNTIAKKAYVRFGYKRIFPWLLLRGKEILYKKL
ncbi:MAG TPA: GNAT family N-acetyltransferase, partial [Chitinivibrionales bacterium]